MTEKAQNTLADTLYPILALISSCLGAYFAALLVYHYQGDTTGMVAQICGSGADSACDKVQKSDLSTLFGMPIAFWGLLFYLTTGILILWAFIKHDVFAWAIALNLAAVGLAFDVFLLIYSIFFVGGVCPMCAITYICSLVLLISLFLYSKRVNFSYKTALQLPPGRSVVTWLVLGLVLLAAPAGSILVYADSVKKKPVPKQADPNDPNAVLRKAYEQFYDMYMKNPVVLRENTGSSPKGAASGVITVVEFADALCPYCKLMGERLSAFVSRHPNKVKVIYRHYPLDIACNASMKRQLHAGSCELSKAMYCGESQGKFWQMHDSVFASQARFQSSPVTYSATEELAVQNGLDKAKFKDCMGSAQAKNTVVRDIEAGGRLKIQGTPTIYMNGRLMPGIHIEFVDGFFEYLLERINSGK